MVLPRKLLIMPVAGCLMLVACGSTGSGLSAGASFFKGLPASVVTEALANPTLKRNMEGMTGEALQSLAQAGVRNMIFCREELHVYQRWIATGQLPAITQGPAPAHPLEPGNAAIVQDYASLSADVRSGDPSQLQSALTGNGSCGQWVPAKPGDPGGPTIAQVVAGGQHA
jgi:hypothetical protein